MIMSVNSYKDLIVWQKSFDLVKNVYKLTAQLPVEEKYGLADQARRCAVSIPSNIAEGHQRNNTKEYRHFLGVARGSAGELETQTLLMSDLYELEVTEVIAHVHEVQKMLQALIKKLSPSP